ncbi:hypothetical protein E2C01_082390 [Portunus trituberculatus]|uniref:Uncharacterized protein n=1 Tax=Portunus trituberculatus TaxID=210409 RepID=A0A5B7J0Q7_PORTR|nr:hypothetical protein [Portunus trituberculatus]
MLVPLRREFQHCMGSTVTLMRDQTAPNKAVTHSIDELKKQHSTHTDDYETPQNTLTLFKTPQNIDTYHQTPQNILTLSKHPRTHLTLPIKHPRTHT